MPLGCELAADNRTVSNVSRTNGVEERGHPGGLLWQAELFAENRYEEGVDGGEPQQHSTQLGKRNSLGAAIK